MGMDSSMSKRGFLTKVLGGGAAGLVAASCGVRAMPEPASGSKSI